MNHGKLKLIMCFAAVCCFALFIPILSGAQTPGSVVHGAKQGVQKGEQGVRQGAEEAKKGAEGAAQETKEGAEAVGHGAKEGAEAVGRGTKEGAEEVGEGARRVIPGENRNNAGARMRGSETQQGAASTEAGPQETGPKELPRSAGELPLLALAGCLALAGAAALRIVRRLE